ncbi:MAG: hypothetical protein E7304_04360 [Butyrivibrio sp.]|uniref:hypothetical protein n=1 Tax=Butyrivibrio sp. TaxID=28121 RepID=UPI001ED2FA74|nr:hypothetical protein [Butyrivibrio sp.]MBE5840625.1 hypothetical protein [Butyrivibrio sp.]
MVIHKTEKCSNCGADIHISEGQERAFCPYCGTEYVIEKRRQGFAEAAFSYLNNAGERRQDQIRRKEEAKERERLRAREDAKKIGIGFLVFCIICVIASLIFGNEKEERQEEKTVETTYVEEKIEKEKKDGFDITANIVRQIGNYEFSIPSYYETAIEERENFMAYAEKGEKVVMLQCSCFKDDEPIDEDWFKDEVRAGEYAESYLSSIKESEFMQGGVKRIGDIEGYLMQFRMSFDGVCGTGWHFIFPSVSDNNWVVVELAQSDNSEYDYYNDFEKIINSFKMDEASAVEKEQNYASTEVIEVSFDKKLALQAFVVAMTNSFSADVFKADGNTVDTNKLHSYADTDCELYFNIVSEGDWLPVDENTWHGYNIKLRPCSGASQAVINDGVCNVTFDGTNYNVKDLRGVLAILGKEEYGTKLSTIEDWPNSEDYLVLSKELVETDRE